jgi:hypothetical protein
MYYNKSYTSDEYTLILKPGESFTINYILTIFNAYVANPAKLSGNVILKSNGTTLSTYPFTVLITSSEVNSDGSVVSNSYR